MGRGGKICDRSIRYKHENTYTTSGTNKEKAETRKYDEYFPYMDMASLLVIVNRGGPAGMAAEAIAKSRFKTHAFEGALSEPDPNKMDVRLPNEEPEEEWRPFMLHYANSIGRICISGNDQRTNEVSSGDANYMLRKIDTAQTVMLRGVKMRSVNGDYLKFRKELIIYDTDDHFYWPLKKAFGNPYNTIEYLTFKDVISWTFRPTLHDLIQRSNIKSLRLEKVFGLSKHLQSKLFVPGAFPWLETFHLELDEELPFRFNVRQFLYEITQLERLRKAWIESNRLISLEGVGSRLNGFDIIVNVLGSTTQIFMKKN